MIHTPTVRINVFDNASRSFAKFAGMAAGMAFGIAEVKHDAAMLCPECGGPGRLAEGWCASARWRWCPTCEHLYGPGKWLANMVLG